MEFVFKHDRPPELGVDGDVEEEVAPGVLCLWSCDWTLYSRVQSQLRRPCAHTINRSKAGVDETLGDRVGKVFLEEEARVAVHDRLCVGDEDALKMPGGRGLGERRDFSIGTLYARLSSCSLSCAAGVEPGHGRRCLSRIWTASLSSASGRRRGDQAHHAAHNERADAHALSEASNLELVGSVPFVPHASLGCLDGVVAQKCRNHDWYSSQVKKSSGAIEEEPPCSILR